MPGMQHRSTQQRSWSYESAGSHWPDGQGPAWLTGDAWAHLEAGGKIEHAGRIYWCYTGDFGARGGEPSGRAIALADVPVRQPTLFEGAA